MREREVRGGEKEGAGGEGFVNNEHANISPIIQDQPPPPPPPIPKNWFPECIETALCISIW